jgi:hypothetical protein
MEPLYVSLKEILDRSILRYPVQIEQMEEIMKYRFGGNEFSNCLVPLIVKDRIVVVEPGEMNPFTKTPNWLISIGRGQGGKIEWDIIRNKPVQNAKCEISTTSAGIITVADKATGRFAYKVRPGSTSSLVFGHVEEGGYEITIKDVETVIKRGNVTIATITKNSFDGVQAGIVIGEDDSIAIGARVPDRFITK